MGGKREGPKGGQHVPGRGFYSRCFKPKEAADLQEMIPEGVGEEIDMLRVSMRRVMEQARRAKTLDERMRQMNVLSMAGLRLAGMVRVQDQIHGKEPGIVAELNKILEEFARDQGTGN